MAFYDSYMANQSIHILGYKFQFSLRQLWVLGPMKVVWLLAVFIAIVTYTPQLTCSGAGYVLV